MGRGQSSSFQRSFTVIFSQWCRTSSLQGLCQHLHFLVLGEPGAQHVPPLPCQVPVADSAGSQEPAALTRTEDGYIQFMSQRKYYLKKGKKGGGE